MTLSLDAAIRTLLLPVRPGTGDEYSQRAEEILDAMGAVEDRADWVNLEAALWETTGIPSPAFKTFVERLLYCPGAMPETFALDASAIGNEARVAEVLGSFASRYFDLHQRVMEEEKVDHQQARRILSHTHTMVLFATGGRMTASRIYSMLLTDGIELGKSWSTVRYILDRCNLPQEMGVAEVQAVFEDDSQAEPDLLGDLDLDHGVSFVAEVCAGFGYSQDMRAQLQTLFITDRHNPYLCMLHFQLTILAWFNHRLTNAYEFKPRGEGVLWLSDQYNSCGLNVGLSPFLNNAKSVDTLDAAWASSKKKAERHAARALTDILRELDCLSDPSRAAAGKYLRALLHRTLRINRPVGGGIEAPLPEFNAPEIARLLAGVAQGNTATRGVIEQRLTDCVALFEAGNVADWRLRGFGDSVFTTNTSQKKFGDAELKHITDARIVAIEAHGGRLTEKYIQDHLFTLRRVLPLRAAELEDRAPLADWLIQLQFFAHDLDAGMSAAAEVGGVQVLIQYRRYAELAAVQVSPQLIEHVENFLRTPLNAIHVHPSVRRKIIQLLQ